MQKFWLSKDEMKEFFDTFPQAEYNEQFDQPNIRVSAAELPKIFDYLKDNKKFPMDMLVDITAVDYLSSDYAERPNLTGREEDLYSLTRFDIVYHFYCMKKNQRIRLITSCGGETPEVISAYPWWTSANFMEREVYDMFGIKFTGHPDLRRVLLYEEFVGHPLRKDYPTMGEQPRLSLRNPEQNNGRI